MISEPNIIDVQVGAKVRVARKAAGLSQEALAKAIGVTFQQLQKYEKGTNRISASKLWLIAEALDTSVSRFFPAKESGGAPSREAMDVARAFDALPPEHAAVIKQVVTAFRRSAQGA